MYKYNLGSILIAVLFASTLTAQPQTDDANITVPVGKASFGSWKGSIDVSSIEGTVTFGKTGELAPGALVRIITPLKAFFPQEPWTVETDENGRFQFENLPVGIAYSVFASFESQISSQSPDTLTIVKLRNSGKKTNVALTLKQAREVVFSVVEAETQKPVANALIELRNHGLDPYKMRLGGLFSLAQVDQWGRTDAKGLTRLAYFGGKTRVSISKAGFANQEHILFTQTPTQEPVVFELDPGGSVKGRVTDEDGNPVSDFRMEYRDRILPIRDSQGHFELQGVPRNEPFTLSFDKDGYLDHIESNISFPLFSDELNLDITMISLGQTPSPKPSLATALSNLSANLKPWKPEKKFRVLLKNNEGQAMVNTPFCFSHFGEKGRGVTDEKGIGFLEFGPQFTSVVVTHLAVANHAPRVMRFTREQIEGSQKPEPIQFDVGQSLKISVQRKDGTAIPEARLYLSHQYQNLLSWEDDLRETDGSGHFHLKHMPHDLTVFVDAWGFKQKSTTFKELKQAQGKLILEGETVFRGKLVDEAGIPIKSFHLKLLGMYKGNSTSFRKQELQVEDESGQFELRNLDPGTSIKVFIQDNKGRAAVVGPLPTRIYDRDKLQTVVLKPHYYAIEKQVVDAKGNPIPGALIWGAVYDRQGFSRANKWDSRELLSHSFTTFETQADEQGRFRIDRIPAGLKAAYYVEAPGRASVYVHPKNAANQDPQEAKQVVMHQAATLNLDIDRAAFPQARFVRLQPKFNDGKWFSLPLDQHSWSKSGLWPDEYIVHLQRATSTRGKFETLASQKVTLEEGKTQTVTFRANQTFTVGGQVIRNGETVLSGFVYLKGSLQSILESRLIDGRFTFSDVEPGDYRMAYSNIKRKGFDRQILTYENRNRLKVDGDIEDFAMEIPFFMTANGQVNHAQEGDVVLLKAKSRRGSDVEGKIDQGAFILDKVKAASYRLSLHSKDHAFYQLLTENLTFEATEPKVDLGSFNRLERGSLIVQFDDFPKAMDPFYLGLVIERVVPDQKFGVQLLSTQRITGDTKFAGLEDGFYQCRVHIYYREDPWLGASWITKKFHINDGQQTRLNLSLFWKKGLLIELEDANQRLETVTVFNSNTQETFLSEKSFQWLEKLHHQFFRIPKGSWRIKATSKQGQVWTRSVETLDDALTTIFLPAKGDK